MTAKKGFEKMMKAEDARGGRGGGGGRFVNEEFQWGVEGFSKDEKKTSVLDGMLRKHEGEGSFHRRLLFLMTLGGVCLVGFFSCALMTVSRVSSSWSIVTFAEASDSDATYHYPHLKELWEFHAQVRTKQGRPKHISLSHRLFPTVLPQQSSAVWTSFQTKVFQVSSGGR